MTETPGQPTGPVPVPEQGTVPYEQAAAQAVGQVQTDAPDAGQALSQMSAERPEPLPHETEMDRLMAQFKAMSERIQQMEAELGQTKAGYAAAIAKLGPPEVATYGKAIFDKLVSFRDAHPDLPGHFSQVIETARPLGETSKAVIDGDTKQVPQIIRDGKQVIDAVDRFITKTHPRLSGKPIDFSALAADLEMFIEAAAKIAA